MTNYYVTIVSSTHDMILGFGPYGSRTAAEQFAVYVDETQVLLGPAFPGYGGAMVSTVAPHVYVSAKYVVREGVMA